MTFTKIHINMHEFRQNSHKYAYISHIYVYIRIYLNIFAYIMHMLIKYEYFYIIPYISYIPFVSYISFVVPWGYGDLCIFGTQRHGVPVMPEVSDGRITLVYIGYIGYI